MQLGVAALATKRFIQEGTQHSTYTQIISPINQNPQFWLRHLET